MQAKSLLLAAALFTFPAATALAQSSASQPASPPSSSSPDAATAPDQSNSAPATASAPAAAPVPATLADLKPKASVYDAAGGKVGTIESVTNTGAVVSTGTARAQLPIVSFNKNDQGLVIGMTKSQFEAAVAKASPPKS